jgi:hypothetical protein
MSRFIGRGLPEGDRFASRYAIGYPEFRRNAGQQEHCAIRDADGAYRLWLNKLA